MPNKRGGIRIVFVVVPKLTKDRDETVDCVTVGDDAALPRLTVSSYLFCYRRIQDMFKGLIGRKVGMTQIFDDDGVAFPVTVIEAGPCYVTQIKTEEKEGYSSVQIGFAEVKPKRLTRGQLGHLERNSLPPLKILREFKTKNAEVSEGDVLKVDVFEEGERVDIVGTSKGRGFAGVMKRHGFAGGPITHGQSDRQRSPGSLGSGTTPGRVFKGKRGPGRMGNERVTSSNVRVVKVDSERNLLAVDGSVPGPKGGMVVIKAARKI